MAKIVFDEVEADGLRKAAREAFPATPALAYTLEKLASEGIELGECRTWDGIRADLGLADTDDAAADVA